MRRQSESQKARHPGAGPGDNPIPAGRSKKKDKAKGPPRDFFGRILPEGSIGHGQKEKKGKAENKVYLTYYEGFSNAVRKPISMDKLLEEL